jgi:hypothetical protein
MPKKAIINRFREYLKSTVSENLKIPTELESEFWEWFERKAKYYSLERIKKKLRPVNIELHGSFCFKNSFKIAKAFNKRYFYYEGFAYRKMDYDFCRHAFNVCKWGKIIDYSWNNKKYDDENLRYSEYVGVKIPLSFIRRLYKVKPKGVNNQYPALVSYFLYQKGDKDFAEFAEI